MSWSFTYFTTTDDDPTVSNSQAVNDVVGNFTLWNDAGDELFIRAGDLVLTLLSPLPFNNGAQLHNWLGAYWDGALYNVYHIGNINLYNNSFGTLDEKRGIYNTRLPAIGAKFYQDLDKTNIVHETVNTNWAFDLPANAKIQVSGINTDSIGVVNDRLAFSVGDIIQNIAGKVQLMGYKIGTITQDLPVKPGNPNNIPVLFNGNGEALTQTDENLMIRTFENNDVTWKHMFEIATAAENAFLVATPHITGNELIIDLNIRRKNRDAGGANTTVNWIDRAITPNSFRIDGVNITGPDNTDYKLGNTESGNIFRKSIKPGNAIPGGVNQSNNLYIASGSLISGPTPLIYSVLDGGNQNIGYFIGSNINSKYNSMLSAGNAYRGRIEFNGEPILTRTAANSDVMHFIRLEADQRGFASVEGVVLI